MFAWWHVLILKLIFVVDLNDTGWVGVWKGVGSWIRELYLVVTLCPSCQRHALIYLLLVLILPWNTLDTTEKEGREVNEAMSKAFRKLTLQIWHGFKKKDVLFFYFRHYCFSFKIPHLLVIIIKKYLIDKNEFYIYCTCRRLFLWFSISLLSIMGLNKFSNSYKIHILYIKFIYSMYNQDVPCIHL